MAGKPQRINVIAPIHPPRDFEVKSLADTIKRVYPKYGTKAVKKLHPETSEHMINKRAEQLGVKREWSGKTRDVMPYTAREIELIDSMLEYTTESIRGELYWYRMRGDDINPRTFEAIRTKVQERRRATGRSYVQGEQWSNEELVVLAATCKRSWRVTQQALVDAGLTERSRWAIQKRRARMLYHMKPINEGARWRYGRLTVTTNDENVATPEQAVVFLNGKLLLEGKGIERSEDGWDITATIHEGDTLTFGEPKAKQDS